MSEIYLNKDIRVVHIIPALFGYEGIFGGAERYALELARAMSQQVPTRLVAFGKQPFSRKEGSLRIEVVRNLIPFRRFRFDPIGPMLIPHLSWATVVHYHQTHTMMASASLIISRLTKRRIFTTHLGSGGFGLHQIFNTDLLFNGHLHISEYSRRIFGHSQLPNAHVIYGGVDTLFFSPPNDAPARSYVLYVGRLLPHKGIDYLIKAIPIHIPLIIAGRPMRHAFWYFELLKELSKGKNIKYMHNVDDLTLRYLYQNALCVVLPSVYQSCDGMRYTIPELLGLTLIEGMACGTPGICTSVASLPEIVQHGLNGFVVPPNNPDALKSAIMLLWSNRDLVQKLGICARQTVLQKFTWSAVVDRCLRLYFR